MSLPKPPMSGSGRPGSVNTTGPAKPGEREGKIETNEKAQETQIPFKRPDIVPTELRSEPEGSLGSEVTVGAQEQAQRILTLTGRAGHEVSIKDQSSDATQFYPWLGQCKCGWQTRQDSYEWCYKFSEHHVLAHLHA